MIITDKVVYIHFPKAGGTFVTKILDRLYHETIFPTYQSKSYLRRITASKPSYIDYREHELFEGVLNERHNHNGFSQIPSDHLSKSIFTTIRNPYDFYVSYFETKKWINPNTMEDSRVKELLPAFPNLNFSEFLRFLEVYYVQGVFQKITGQVPLKNVGLYTLLFVLMYSENPNKVYTIMRHKDSIGIEDLSIGKHITFLNYGDLNNALFQYLSKHYNPHEVDFIFEAKKENVSPNRKSPDWSAYYSEDDYELITKCDFVGLEFFNKLVKK